MQALVTGGAGFIGGHLARALVAEGHTVRCLDDLSAGHERNVPPEAQLVRADLRDAPAVDAAVHGCEVVFHQAARTSVPRSLLTPDETTDINVRGTLNVLMAAHRCGARLVAASSSSVYGDQPSMPLREEMLPRPKSPYAASKLALESYCGAYARSFGVPAVCLRYFNVYGPGQDPDSPYAAVIPRFMTACVEGRAAEIHGDGGQARDFTFVSDVVQANLLASASAPEAWGETFNVGAGREPTTVTELFGLIARLHGSAVPDPVHVEERAGDIRRSQADVDKAGRILGYKPEVPLPEGLAITFRAFLAGTHDLRGSLPR